MSSHARGDLEAIERQALTNALDAQRDVLVMEDYLLRRLLYAEPEINKPQFGLGQAAEHNFRGDQEAAFHGVFVFNPNPIVLQIAFEAGSSVMGVPIPPFTWLRLPQRFVNLSLGLANVSDASGPVYTATVARLRVPPAPGAGPAGGATVLASGATLTSLDAVPNAKGKTHTGVVIASNGNSDVPLNVAGYRRLTILARMTATAAGDLLPFAVPYEDDGATLSALSLPVLSTGSVLSAGTSVQIRTFDLGGIERVAVRLINANAAAQTATSSYFLQR